MAEEPCTKQQWVAKAKICEEMERFETMARFMKNAAEKGRDEVEGADQEIFDQNERNLFSVAYKNVVGTRRSAWRVVSAKENKESTDPGEKNLCEELRKGVEDELKKICKEVLDIIENTLYNNAKLDDTKVFYSKMKGDYYRYLAEIEKDDQKVKENAKAAYTEANNEATKLDSTHPIRLGLALNFSVFYFEIMNDPTEACHLAKQAFDDAIANLDNLKEDSYKDSTLIMQLLRDNLTLWTSGDNEEEEN